MARKDPLRNFRFRLEVDGIQQAGFSEVNIGETVTDAVDYREGADISPHVRKLSGLTKIGNITLKRGVTDSMDLFNWHKQIVAGQVAANRKTVAIVVVDEAGNDKARFVVMEAWPIKYDVGDLNGKESAVLIEFIELTHEGCERVQ